MNKVFIVTDGYYSDYKIIGVYSSKKSAQEVIDSFSDLNESQIEEWGIDTVLSFPKGMKCYFLRMTKEGKAYDIDEGRNTIMALEYALKKYMGFGSGGHDLFCNVLAKDKEHAVKIVNEKRIQLIESNRWGKE